MILYLYYIEEKESFHRREFEQWNRFIKENIYIYLFKKYEFDLYTYSFMERSI